MNEYITGPRPQLFNRWFSAVILLINLYPVNNAIGFPNTYPMDIVIYLVDSAIHLWNNWGLICLASFPQT